MHGQSTTIFFTSSFYYVSLKKNKCFIRQSWSYKGETIIWGKCFTIILGIVVNIKLFYKIKAGSIIHLKASRKSQLETDDKHGIFSSHYFGHMMFPIKWH